MKKDIKKEILTSLNGGREIVINGCYGGFGLSNKAILKLIKMKSEIIKKMPIKEYYGETRWEKEIEEVNERKVNVGGGFYADKYYDGILFNEESVFFIDRDKEIRDNEDLIEVVRELGKEANTRYAELKIVKIPANVDWEIDEYDGIETIREKHRSWY